MKLLPLMGAHQERELDGGGDIDFGTGSGAPVARVDKWHKWSGGLLIHALEWRKWRREWSLRSGKRYRSEAVPTAQIVVAALLVMRRARCTENSGAGALPLGRPSTHSVLFELFKYFQTHSNLKRSKMVFCCSKIFK
jgi:hypothetical protein